MFTTGLWAEYAGIAEGIVVGLTNGTVLTAIKGWTLAVPKGWATFPNVFVG